jgi:hypothetical protein
LALWLAGWLWLNGRVAPTPGDFPERLEVGRPTLGWVVEGQAFRDVARR